MCFLTNLFTSYFNIEQPGMDHLLLLWMYSQKVFCFSALVHLNMMNVQRRLLQHVKVASLFTLLLDFLLAQV